MWAWLSDPDVWPWLAGYVLAVWLVLSLVCAFLRGCASSEEDR